MSGVVYAILAFMVVYSTDATSKLNMFPFILEGKEFTNCLHWVLIMATFEVSELS